MCFEESKVRATEIFHTYPERGVTYVGIILWFSCLELKTCAW